MLDRWDEAAGLGRTIDMAHEMTALTLRIVARTLLSAEVREHSDEVGRAVTLFSRYADAAVASLLPIGFPTPLMLRTRDAHRRLDAIIQSIIAEQLKLGPDELVTCGLSCGYADEAAAVNHLNMPREPMDAFTRWLGFDG